MPAPILQAPPILTIDDTTTSLDKIISCPIIDLTLIATFSPTNEELAIIQSEVIITPSQQTTEKHHDSVHYQQRNQHQRYRR